MPNKVAIVAALEREVKPIIRSWSLAEREYQSRKFKFFENERAVLICGGIGAEAARRATQAIIALYEPHVVISVGFAGALEPGMKAGDLFVPQWVVDARDTSRTETGIGKGTLVSSISIATTEQKSKLAKSYAAQGVDMEASAVAHGAQARGIRFFAVKAISDECDFDMPELDRFIRNEKFCTSQFVVWTAAQPWLWSRVIRLAKNSSKATKSLCRWLDQYNHPAELLDNPRPGLHLISES